MQEEKQQEENTKEQPIPQEDKNSDESKQQPEEKKVKLIHPSVKFAQKVTLLFDVNIQSLENYIAAVDEVLLHEKIEDRTPEQIANHEPGDWKRRLKLLWYRTDVMAAIDKVNAMKKLYQLREEEFKQGYLPKFEEDLKACNKYFDELYERSKYACKFLKENYFTIGIGNYPERNPDDADLELRIVFFKFMLANIQKMEKTARLHPDYKPFKV